MIHLQLSDFSGAISPKLQSHRYIHKPEVLEIIPLEARLELFAKINSSLPFLLPTSCYTPSVGHLSLGHNLCPQFPFHLHESQQ